MTQKSEISHRNPVIGMVIALIASLLVMVTPLDSADAAYTSHNTGPIVYNDQVCNLGDPANHQSAGTAFQISTPDQLWEITDCVSNSATIYFELASNIDISQAITAPTNSPIGFSTSALAYSFSGVIDGGNKVISGISMSASSYGVGLFAYLHNATISNLVISGEFVTTTTDTNASDSAGALAIRADGSLDLSSISNEANVTGSDYVAGLVGYVSGSAIVDTSVNSGAISGSTLVGGLLGYVLNNATVANSLNTGTVSGSAGEVGGLVGHVNVGDADIDNSQNTGPISGSSIVGGLVGQVAAGDAKINNSHNTATVSGAVNDIGGLVGLISGGGYAYVDNSHNTGPVSGAGHIGGLVGFVTSGGVTMTSSHNTGAIFGSFDVGGLVGFSVLSANIDTSHNTGTVSGTGDNVGGLLGYVANVGVNIDTSRNTGAVAGSSNVGGLVGSSAPATIETSHNTGTISGTANYVGGLLGFADNNSSITSAYNTGPVSGSQFVGGLMGEVANGGSATMDLTYNTGPVSGVNSDGLVGSVQGTVTTTSAYSSVNSAYVSTKPVADMKLASTFAGFDFENTWGFGSPADNQGFPMLRVFAELTSYFSDFAKFSSNSDLVALALSQGTLDPVFTSGTTTYTASVPNAISSITVIPTRADSGASITVEGIAVSSGNASGAISLAVGSNALSIVVTAADSTSTTTYTITVTRAAAEQNQGQTPAQPPAYAGPVIAGAQSAAAGTEVTFTGNRLESVTSAEVGGVQVTIVSALAEAVTLEIPSSMLPGTYDLKLQSSFGTLTVQNGIAITAGLNESATPVTEVEAADQKLTVGSFRGFIAIYTKGYEGQRLSAKVAGKWLVIESLDESFKGNDYSRTVRRTGSGFSIKVHLYIDREFVRTEDLITQ